MPKTATPLQRAAAAQDDAAREKKVTAVLGDLAALLGAPGLAAKMAKRTEVTKHTVTEESDDPPASEEEEEEAEMDSASSAPTSTEKSGDSAPADDAKAEEEEEEEEEAAAKPAGSSEEEEEEKAIAKAWAAAEKAYAKAAVGVDALGVFGPKGLRKMAAKATGATTVKAALAALHGMRGTVAKAKATAIQGRAQIEARLATVEAAGRKTRVDAIVDKAKVEGRAPSRDLRAELRAHGMEHGSKALRRLVATLPVVARTTARDAKHDAEGNALGAPNADEQRTMEKAMAGLSAEERVQFKAIYADKVKALNGAGRSA